jgi:hypothetical protein
MTLTPQHSRLLTVGLSLAAILCYRSSVLAVDIVNDTWQDGERNHPAAPVYSENGTDGDGDTDLESAWYQGGDGTLDPVGPGGPLRGAFSSATSTSSASWTTYFTPEGSEVELTNPGDQLKVTWIFTPTNVNASNGSQNFRIALVDSPGAARLAAEGAPGSALYTGYGMFINFGETTGRSTPFQLKERDGLNSAFLSASASWPTVADAPGFGNGAVNYASGTEYTFEMTITRDAANQLDVEATMSGGNINSTGSVSVSATGLAPNGGSFKFDTFGLRPSGATTTAEIFDTRLLRVEGPRVVPEPAALSLMGLGLAVLGVARRRN